MKTQKDWFSLLEETPDESLLLAPHVIIQSTLKYFKSKGPGLNRLSIIAEDEERCRLNDGRIIFLRRPQRHFDSLLNLLKGYFPRHVHYYEQKNMIKVCYLKRALREKDLLHFYKDRPKWPDGRTLEIMRLDSNMFRNMEILYKELVIWNVRVFSNIKLECEVGTKFPTRKEYREEPNKLVIVFASIQQAYEVYKRSKEMEFCGYKVSIVYNKKKRHFDSSFIIKEERFRCQDNDSRMIFVKYPDHPMSERDMERDLKHYFENYGHIIFLKKVIKICYKQDWQKIKDFYAFKKRRREPSWKTKEAIQMIDMPADTKWLSNEIIQTELILRKLQIKGSDEMLEKVTKRVFPSSIQIMFQLDNIILRFKDPFDALEAFKNGKGIEICQWKTNIFFNRHFQKSFSSSFGRRDRSRSPLRRR